MFLVPILRYALHLLVPLSLFSSFYLYLYPAFHQCAFPSPEENAKSEFITTLRQHSPLPITDAKKVAPFRLLALGDPQLEGDSSIDYVNSVNFPSLGKFLKDSGLRSGEHHNFLQRVRHSLHDLVDLYLDDIPNALHVYRKRLDHFGNDYYLGHIYRTIHWWTNPTHVTVLGDLVGSQWIDDQEFESRGWRFWNRVFKGGVRVPDELFSEPVEDFKDTLRLGDDAAAWKRRLINVAGNHDIGYAGDISPERMVRFTRVFGKANYELRFQIPLNSTSTTGKDQLDMDRPIPELRIVVLNDMNLDTPAGSKELQDETYQFLNKIITTSPDVERAAHFTLLLTHIPMYKPGGVCVDGPFFDFFSGNFNNGVKEQNHLSMDASKGFLEGIFGMYGNPNVPGQGYGRNGVVLTGHDHEGCDIYHYVNQSDSFEPSWRSTTWSQALSSNILDQAGIPGMREITVRSMMGAFGGNAGLMSLWFDEDTWEWQFEFKNCSLGTQHIWWTVHILVLITIGVAIVYGALLLASQFVGFVPEKALRNEQAMTASSKLGHIGNSPVRLSPVLDVDGKLNIPESGSKSLRKRKTKILNGSSPNGSVASDSAM